MPIQFEPLSAPARRPWALACWPFVAALALGVAACSSPMPRPSGEAALAPAPLAAVPVAPPSRPSSQARVAQPAAESVDAAPASSAPGERPDAATAAEATAATRKAPAADAIAVFAKGRASWYGKRFHGRHTASGERFDMHALTAAHKTLPFGTRVRVRSVHSGKEVVVRINDRGPFAHRRIIDLSHAAATALGVHHHGVTEVHLLRE
ncbi:septal ring lytic transglycosylase RlpA family protein [Hydrogenophaga sp.]|uniref:septal ring lytic transglycosylase RlpA family protein n=1 Tax=Hydrogenophaga sp. TaxID=1904254 RepID=UPI0027226EF4|nr:septal ring lytic transglycosylase RlpA family protein [Hydrogenophaga sp.]MDO9606414.1 septal ring lytic transglycosylase RlpA family protein [Hydrogenophaga sp.]